MNKKEAFFLRVEFKLMNVERMMDIDNHNLANTSYKCWKARIIDGC